MENKARMVSKKVKPVSEPSRFSDIDIHPERGDNELYCDYKCRMWWANRILRRYRKGRVISYGGKPTNH